MEGRTEGRIDPISQNPSSYCWRSNNLQVNSTSTESGKYKLFGNRDNFSIIFENLHDQI